jgi:hypothetical protein
MKRISIKRIAFAIMITSVIASCVGQTNVANKNKKSITIDSNLVKSFYKDSIYKSSNLYFDTIASIKRDFNNNGILDIISLLKVKEWDDSGDFQRIIISLDNNKAFDVVNYDGWSMLQEGMKKGSLIPPNYCGMYQINNGNNLLVLCGFVYGSGPSFSTIIDFSTGTPRIIYNLKSNFDSIENRNDMIILKGYTNDESLTVTINEDRILIKPEYHK